MLTGIEALKSMGRLTERHRPDGSVVLQVEKDFPIVVKEVNEESAEVDFVATDGRVDRMGDTINVNGWDTEHFRKHGSILVDHVYEVDRVVGKPKKVKTEGAGENRHMVVRAAFGPKGNARVQDVLEKLHFGSVKNVSVGFNPVKWEWRRSEEDEEGHSRIIGINFLEQELLEVSVVAVPANPGAHVLAAQLERECDEAETLKELYGSLAQAELRLALERTLLQLKGA